MDFMLGGLSTAKEIVDRAVEEQLIYGRVLTHEERHKHCLMVCPTPQENRDREQKAQRELAQMILHVTEKERARK